TGTGVEGICNSGAGGAVSFVNQDQDGVWQCFAGGVQSDANIVGYVALDPHARFVQAEVGTVSTLGRNTISTPGLNVWNMSVFKTTKINERFSLQFRAATYDTFNHRNFSIGLPTNNGTIDQTSNANPLNAGYIFVNSSP